MKKMLSLLTSLFMLTSAVSLTASAQEYEKCPSAEESGSWTEYYKELSDGINDGRYFADFDGNGVFDPIDADILRVYYRDISTLSNGNTIDNIDWTDKTWTFVSYFNGSFLNNYETYELNGETAVTVYLNNEMLENVRKYGDIDNNGTITSIDAAELLGAYYSGFETGDVNADNSVNSSDASYILNYYSKKSTGQAIDSTTEKVMELLADVNNDGEVDANDANEVLSTYSDMAV